MDIGLRKFISEHSDLFAEADALFARHAILLQEQLSEKNTARGKAIAEQIRDARLRIICKLSDVPRTAIESWPLGAQVAVLNTINEINDRDDENAPDKEEQGGQGGTEEPQPDE